MFNKGGQGKQRGFGFGGFSLANKKDTPPLAPAKVLQSRSQKTKSIESDKQGSELSLPEKRRP
jgi:hypothetical protein